MKRALFLLLLDAVCYLSSFFAVITLRAEFNFIFFQGVYTAAVPLAFQIFYFCFLVPHLAACYFIGFYEEKIREVGGVIFFKAAAVSLGGVSLFTVSAYVFDLLLVPRSVTLPVFVFSGMLLFLTRWGYYHWLRRLKKKRILLVQEFPPKTPKATKSELETWREKQKNLRLCFRNFSAFKAQLVGFLGDQPQLPRACAASMAPLFLGSYKNLGAVVREREVDLILVFSDRVAFKETLLSLFDKLSLSQVALYFYPSKYEIAIAPFAYLNLGGIPFAKVRGPKKKFLLKRALDFALAFFLLVSLAPLFLLLYVLVRLDSAGGGFYVQKRVGRRGLPFFMYKFRTMKPNAEQTTGPVLSSAKDGRLTWVGKTLRRLRLDELPQLLNVLRGEMSFVGPRPERPFFVEKFKQKTPYYSERLEMKPGLTGLAQVEGGYKTHFQDKLRYDLWYIHHYSLRLDVLIFFRTVKIVLTKRGS